MAYLVDTAEPVKQYLRAVAGLSREGRLKLFTGYLEALRERGDELRSEPSARYPGNSSLFTFRHIFQDGERIYTARSWWMTRPPSMACSAWFMLICRPADPPTKALTSGHLKRPVCFHKPEKGAERRAEKFGAAH
jgi:hypothetical protein